MKALASLVTLLALCSFSPADDGKTKRRIIGGGGFDGGGVNITKERRVTAPQKRTVVQVSPLRAWKSTDGKTINASLMAWPIEGDLTAAKTLKFDIVREGKIRLKKGEKTFTLALTKLSKEDQEFVKKTVEATKTAKFTPAKGSKKPAPKS